MGHVDLYTLENTPSLHNVIVCTCARVIHVPRWVFRPIGTRAEAARARVVREPRAVLSEFGTNLPEDVRFECTTVPPTSASLYRHARKVRTIGGAALESLITRDTMIGVTLPSV